MEFRRLGHSGLKVPVISYGAATFGGKGEFFKAFGDTDVKEATRLVDICLDAGVNFFDTADVYSAGASEEVLGKALGKRRGDALISTKMTFRMTDGPNGLGSSRHRLIKCCEDSLRRLGTDYIDIYHMHGFDALTPLEEVMSTLETLVQAGKVRYIGCSNFSGWHLMKSLAISEKYGWARHVSHQAYYSLIGREYEWELMPLALDQNVGTMVWSPLGWGRLTGKIGRSKPLPEVGKKVPQVALNWLLQRPTVANVVIGARNEEQLRQNLEAVGWNLTPEQVAKLDAASETPSIYPYWHQRQFTERNPLPVPSVPPNPLPI